MEGVPEDVKVQSVAGRGVGPSTAEIEKYKNGSKIEILPSTSDQMSGPHPPKIHADEVELMSTEKRTERSGPTTFIDTSDLPAELEIWREGLEARPPALTMWEARKLRLKDIPLPEVASDPIDRLPQAIDPVHLRAGDQITLEWVTREGSLDRFTGTIMRIEIPRNHEDAIRTRPENVSPDDRWWVYLSGVKNTYLRSPIDEISQIVSHLMYIKGGVVQTSRYEEHGR